MEQAHEGREDEPRLFRLLEERGEQRGRAEGEARGMALGEARGVALGEIRTLRRVVLTLLEKEGIAISEQQRAEVEACADADKLNRWVANLPGAKTAADVFG